MTQHDVTSDRPRASEDARWVPAGERVMVAGYEIPDGLLYVGQRLASVKAWTGQVEPSLLDTTLPVDGSAPDYQGRLMPYWPSYSEIQPASRAAYLQWLAGGRRAPEIGIGYVFLYFSGLERRVLYELSKSEAAAGEIQVITREVERLADIYAANASFSGQASSFLGMAALLKRPVKVETLQPPTRREGWELPPVLRLALGALAADGKPLPPEWALSWLVTSPEAGLRTPAYRCPDEFEGLFALRYRERFGEGIRLPQTKTRLKIEYRPASPSFEGPVTITAAIPDVAGCSDTFAPLRELAGDICQELDLYSRWAGKTGETDTPSAVALLPMQLARYRGDEDTQALSSWLQGRLGSQEIALVDSEDLLGRWPSKTAGRPTKRELEMLSDFLATRGVGVEPDVTFGGGSLRRTRHAALFRLPGGVRQAPGAAYKGAAVLLHLAALVAAADGRVCEDEERHLAEHLERSLDLLDPERTRLAAHFRCLAVDPPRLTASRKRIEELSEGERHGLGAFLISLAGADGRIDPEEIAVLSKIYPLLGLEPQTLYSDAHQLMTSAGSTADQPITVRPAGKRTGFTIPRPEVAASGSQGIELDPEKLRAMLADTARVANLLSEIFVSQEEPGAPPAPQAPLPVATDDFAVAGLDGAHSALLLRLASATSWEPDRLERMAAILGLPPEGALEVINEAAISACGAPVLEWTNVIEIDNEVFREMLA